MATDRYGLLGLTDNPFPRIPTVNPTSPDVRMNGSIYNEDIFRDQIAALRQRLERRENLIYAQNTRFVVGVGKSALIAREWRRLQEQSPEAAVYIRCGRNTRADSVTGACNTVADAWLKNGALWKAFCGILKEYESKSGRSDLNRGTIDTLISLHPVMPYKVSAGALMIWDVKGTVENIASWLEDAAPRIHRDVVIDYLSAMLSAPRGFGDTYPKKAKKRELTAFVTLLDLLRIGGVGYLYVFLDQFEELFHGQSQRQVHELASGMRQILEGCPGLATFVVTLHPSAAMQLRSADLQSLTTIAPVDDRRVVDLPNINGAQAVQLAQTYLDRFRMSEAGDSSRSAPFEEECIKWIAIEQDGNIREILQTLHYCVEAAAEKGHDRINETFIEQYHREITGKVSEKELEL